MFKSLAVAAASIALLAGPAYSPPAGSDRFTPHQGNAHMLNLPNGNIRPGQRLDVQGHVTPILVCSGCDDWSWWRVRQVGKLRVTASGPFLSPGINRADKGMKIIQWYYEGKGHDPKIPYCATTAGPSHPRFVVLELCGIATRWVMYPGKSGSDPFAFASVSIAATNEISKKTGTSQYVLYNLSTDGNLSTANKLGFFQGQVLGPESWDFCGNKAICTS